MPSKPPGWAPSRCLSEVIGHRIHRALSLSRQTEVDTFMHRPEGTSPANTTPSLREPPHGCPQGPDPPPTCPRPATRGGRVVLVNQVRPPGQSSPLTVHPGRVAPHPLGLSSQVLLRGLRPPQGILPWAGVTGLVLPAASVPHGASAPPGGPVGQL